MYPSLETLVIFCIEIAIRLPVERENDAISVVVDLLLDEQGEDGVKGLLQAIVALHNEKNVRPAVISLYHDQRCRPFFEDGSPLSVDLQGIMETPHANQPAAVEMRDTCPICGMKLGTWTCDSCGYV